MANAEVFEIPGGRYCPECGGVFAAREYPEHWKLCPARARNRLIPDPTLFGGSVPDSPSGKLFGANNGAGDLMSLSGRVS